MMKRILLFLLVVLAIASFGDMALANPFLSGRPSPASAAALNLFGTPFLQQILIIQRGIHEALTNGIEALKNGNSLAALWWLLLLSFGYGVFHVLAPGHGKVIVTSYFLGNDADWRDGVWAGLIMSTGHTLTAVGLVVVLYLVLGLTQFGVIAHARYAELLGYGLIMAVGLWLLYKAIRNKPTCGHCGHAHHGGHDHHHHDHHHEHDHAEDGTGDNDHGRSLFAVASLVPCSGSMIILLFTVANGVLWAGILAVLAIALGMWLTVTAIGFVSIFLRHLMVGEGQKEPGPVKLFLLKGLRIGTALIVVATGGLLFAGTLYSLYS